MLHARSHIEGEKETEGDSSLAFRVSIVGDGRNHCGSKVLLDDRINKRKTQVQTQPPHTVPDSDVLFPVPVLISLVMVSISIATHGRLSVSSGGKEKQKDEQKWAHAALTALHIHLAIIKEWKASSCRGFCLKRHFVRTNFSGLTAEPITVVFKRSTLWHTQALKQRRPKY